MGGSGPVDSRTIPVVAHVDGADCSFCFSQARNYWFNRPVAREGDCALAVPSLGSLVPGYLLIVPPAHVTSTSRIPDDEKAKFASFTADISRRLTSLYEQPVTMFEHGACTSQSQLRSACVSHAHLHLVPGRYSLISEAVGEATRYPSYERFLDNPPEDPYLMLQDPDGPVVSIADRPSPQFFRQVIARRLGTPECWDYALYPFFDNIERTYKDFGIDVR
jgi:diadenosine tetraphosphate (Ap4A) HIT family hydrolase